MEKQIILASFFFIGLALLQPAAAKAFSGGLGKPETIVSPSPEFLTFQADPVTVSLFTERKVTVTKKIPFKIEYRDDPDEEWGKEILLHEGRNGKITKTYSVTYWEGKEVSRKLVKIKTEAAQNRIISRGTKIIWREVPDKGYKYWAKLHVWATSYDGHCAGCRGLTYSGTPVRQGVCAVDPRLIPLGTNFYVPGYGICRAEDIGGAIKGYKIDLGFEDIKRGFWSARYTDIYLLTNAPVK